MEKLPSTACTPFGQSGTLRGSKLVPSKRRCPVPPSRRKREPLGNLSHKTCLFRDQADFLMERL